MNVFDNIGKTAFSTISQVMGDAAFWTPAGESVEQKGTVLFNMPSAEKTLGDIDKYSFNPYKYSFEYYEGTFSGLKPAVDSGSPEVVKIKDVDYDVKKVDAKIDGKNFIAYCELHESL